MTAPREHRLRLARTALIACAVAAALFHCWWFSDFTVDDGAISFCYARSLAHGHGLVLVPGGERVEGYTNFLWVILLATGIRVGLEVVLWSHLLGAAAAVATVIGTAELVAELRGRRSLLDAIPALVCATLLPVAYWAMSGLEGGLYCALVTWCAVRLLAEQRDPSARRPLSALLAAGAALTRPEAVAILGLACAIRLSFDRDPRRLARWYALALLPVLLHFVWRCLYYAYPVPNTFYAKIDKPMTLQELADWKSGGWWYVRAFALRYQLTHIVYLVVLTLIPTGPKLWTRIGLFGMLLALTLFPVYSRGDWMSEGRFLVATLPLFVALLCDGIGRLVRLLPWPKLAIALSTAAFVLLAALVIPNSLALSRARRHVYPVPMAAVGTRGSWYRATADRFAIEAPSALDGDLGGSTYLANMQMVDLGSLADVTLSHGKVDSTTFREYIYNERRPTFMHIVGFWVDDGLKWVPEFGDDYVPGKSDGMFIDRSVFLEADMDTRAPLGTLPHAAIDLLRAEVGVNDVALWLLVRGNRGIPYLASRQGRVPVIHPILDRYQWRPGDIVRVKLARPAGRLQLCETEGACVSLAEGQSGAAPLQWPKPSAALLARVEQRGELEIALQLRRRLGMPLSGLAERFYTRALAERSAGDTAGAFRDFSAALAADPSRSWARRHIEELRQSARRPYRYIYSQRLDMALRDMRLNPNPANMSVVAQLAQAADEPLRAAAAYLAFGVAPDAVGARIVLAECLARAGAVDESLTLLSDTPTTPSERASVDWIRSLAGQSSAAAPAGKQVAPGLILVSSWARLADSGRVRLSLALRKSGAAPNTLVVGGRALPFDRAPATWGDGEVFVHSVALDLPAGRRAVEVGTASVTVDVAPFTHDFENGRSDGWVASGDGFAATRWSRGLPMRASEGAWSVTSGASGAATGELRSPPLADNVDELCFVLAGGFDVGVELDSAPAATITGHNDAVARPGCLAVAAGKRARVVLYDRGKSKTSWLQADDFACFAQRAPVPCAGSATIVE